MPFLGSTVNPTILHWSYSISPFGTPGQVLGTPAPGFMPTPDPPEVHMITHVPSRFEVWFASLVTRLREARRPQEPSRPEPEIWTPKSDTERAVLAALILAGKAVTNDELAQLMGCSKGEASRRVTEADRFVRKIREGRRVQISLLN